MASLLDWAPLSCTAVSSSLGSTDTDKRMLTPPRSTKTIHHVVVAINRSQRRFCEVAVKPILGWVAVSLATVWAPSGHADTIRLKDGRTTEGEIIEQTQKRVTIKSVFGPIQTFRREEIKQIEEDEKATGQPPSATVPPSTPTPGVETSGDSKSTELSAAEIFERVAPAVVVIVTRKENGEESQASGFIVDSKGIVVSSLHNVLGAKEGQIKLKDGRDFPILGMIGLDGAADISILKVGVQLLPTVVLGDSDQVKPGQQIFVISAPYGLGSSISEGVLSSVRETPGSTLLQLTASISPGSSGAPILNAQGKVIGIVNSGTEMGQPLNFATAINHAKRWLDNPMALIPLDQMKRMAPGLSQLSFPSPLALAQHGLPDTAVQSYDSAKEKEWRAEQQGDHENALFESERRLLLCQQHSQAPIQVTQDCIGELIGVLRLHVLVIQGAQPIDSFEATMERIITAGPYSKRCIGVIEQNGGVDTIVDQLALVYGKGEGLEEMKGKTLGYCYWTAGLVYVNEGDEKNAQRCLTVLKRLVPKSVPVQTLEPLVKEMRKRAIQN